MDDAKQLAIQEAQTQGCDIDIVLATIDAETSFSNILGDNGNAIGYGQVWPWWHMDAFRYAGQRLGIQVPNSLVALQQIALNNDEFSMIESVFVIKQIWLASNKDWHTFTLSYVGPAIPDNDYNRRKAIWDRYNNGNDTSNYTGFGSNTSPMSGAQVNNNQGDIQPTNYGIVPDSIRSGNVLYGRRYRIVVSNSQGIGLDVSDLRCTFSVTKTVQMQPNVSEITIYNLNAETENRIIQEGNRIVIEAGYEGEQYGLIFDGDIIQTIRDKEDGVTYKLTLVSMDGDRFFNNGSVNTTLTKGQTARKVVEGILNTASNPAKFGSISDNLDETKLTRGKVIFGLARDYLRQVAQSQNATFYIENNQVNIVKAEDVPEGEIIDLSPSSGLIGVPAQTQMGVAIKCLLNPQITTNKLIHIDNSLIREMQRPPVVFSGNGTQLPAIQPIRNLDNDGVYRIIKVTYNGDTRGENWYCEIETINQAGLLPSIATTPTTKLW